MAGHREEYLAAGMNDYASKPIDPQALFQAIVRVCGHAKPARQDGCTADNTLDGGGNEKLDRTAADALPLFDEVALGRLRGAVGGEVLQTMLGNVSGESEKLLHDIQSALGDGDLLTARRHAHTLKGMAGNCAATRIAAAADEFESESRTLEEAREKSASLERVIEETQRWLRKSA